MSRRVKLRVWEQSWELGDRVCKGLLEGERELTRLEKQQVRGVPDEPVEGRAYLGEHWEIRVLMRSLEVI